MANAIAHGSGTVTVSCRQSRDRVVVEVTDEGPGVAGAVADQLFVPFARFGENEGTGLGLAISRSLVEAHGGSLRYRPPGPGPHAFVLDLPAADSHVPAAEALVRG